MLVEFDTCTYISTIGLDARVHVPPTEKQTPRPTRLCLDLRIYESWQSVSPYSMVKGGNSVKYNKNREDGHGALVIVRKRKQQVLRRC
ncbi:uncharacterized protein PHACADRAFT_246271 [Phanerochaete carnosa HHB-10118-sp]|uniref:Uncharacterized protein n=1 Tax=Phanerochaete carnosa (strain HHB-10118-sp) TaxID=650164 RepID=K5W8Y7_PHACS|nr:uncharacterized protein PHACADRAFT_246271 [Phanerochaete carnosa HHB-10118-sp]EKM60388.1 hypothetical protein PHACADRAFT_246271 [Phanerochaete carnosa HHB-10118-sp]